MAGVPPGRRSQCGLLGALKRTYLINRWENLQIPLCLARASFPFYHELTPFPGRQNDVGRSRLKIGAWDEKGGGVLGVSHTLSGAASDKPYMLCFQFYTEKVFYVLLA